MNESIVIGRQVDKLMMSKLRPWIVCFSAALFFFYEFIQLNMFNSISALLMRDFHVNAVKLGNLSAMYLYADVLFLFPAGIILDRVSVRKIILIAMSLCVVGTFLFAQATAFWFAALCHFVAGIGNAFSFLSCIMLASRWFPPRRMALVTGLIVTFAMAGGLVAQTPLTLLVQHAGWRDALMLNGLLGVLILFVNWLFIKDYPNGVAAKMQKTLQTSFLKGIKLVLLNVQNWLYGLYTSLLNFPIMALGALWGSLSLIQGYHLTAQQASYVTSMIFVGTIVGGPLTGWISDKLALRKLPMIIFALLSLAVMLAILYVPQLDLSALILLFFLLGLFTSAQVISYPAIAESNPRFITGTATGLASVIIMGGGAISQPLFGYLLDLRWNHLIINNTPIYALSDIKRALLMMPVAFIIGLIAVLLARETRCQPVKETMENEHVS